VKKVLRGLRILGRRRVRHTLQYNIHRKSAGRSAQSPRKVGWVVRRSLPARLLHLKQKKR
jgi:hypothetical protein